MSVVVSAKVPEELKKKADLYGIKIGNVIRDALEEKIKSIENEMLSEQLDQMRKEIGHKVTKKDVVEAVRSSRAQR